MKFLIVGPGAMGCLFAARLKNAGDDVTLLDYRADRAAEINHQGIAVNGITGSYHVRVPTVSGLIPESLPDAVFLCVKSYHTRQAALTLRQFLPPGIPVVTLQNGLGNVELLSDIFGKENVLGGITAEGATLQGPGKIRHAGQGETVIGVEKGRNTRAANDIAAALSHAGFHARVAEQVENLIWGKLIINVGINALTAITRLKNGRLPEVEGTRRIIVEAVEEAAAVAKARHIELPYSNPVQRVMEVCRATSENMASMLQDVLKKSVTEVDFINGAIVREGALSGVQTPVNRTLTWLVKAIEETYLEMIR